MTVFVPAEVCCVLFDAVGTLIYPDPPVADVYRAAGQRFGSRLVAQEIALQFRQAIAAERGSADDLRRPPTSESHEVARWRRIVTAVFSDVSPPAADGLFHSLWQHFAQSGHWRTFPDAQPVLRRLQQRGLRLAIASNFDSRLLQIAAKTAELSDCEETFVSSQVGFSKPDPRFFAAVAAQLDVAPSRILLVGDDWLADVQGARAAGWQAVWLNRHPAMKSTEPAIASLLELAPC